MATCGNRNERYRSLREILSVTMLPRCARYGAPSAGSHGLRPRDGYCAVQMWSFAKDMRCVSRRWGLAELSDHSQISECVVRASSVLHASVRRQANGHVQGGGQPPVWRPQRVCPRTRAVVALMLRWFVVARSDRKMKQELQ